MNGVLCLTCHIHIVSRHRHDYVTCACHDPETQVSVDGGEAYIKRSYGSKAKWQEMDTDEVVDKSKEVADKPSDDWRHVFHNGQTKL